jgi:hypothetical protein
MRELEGAVPAWLAALDDEDYTFLKRFLLSSGSLKELAASYGVSYPTVRARVDRLIAKVRAVEAPEPRDPFERTMRVLLADGALAPQVARRLIKAHRDSIHQEQRT